MISKKGIGFRNLTTGIFIVTLFGLMLFLFLFQYISNNNPNSAIFDSKYGINSSMDTFNSSISDITSSTDTIKIILTNNTNPDPISYLFLIAPSMLQIPMTIVSSLFSVVTSLPTIIFLGFGGIGMGNTLSGVISFMFTLLIITIILLIIKVIRTGETER